MLVHSTCCQSISLHKTLHTHSVLSLILMFSTRQSDVKQLDKIHLQARCDICNQPAIQMKAEFSPGWLDWMYMIDFNTRSCRPDLCLAYLLQFACPQRLSAQQAHFILALLLSLVCLHIAARQQARAEVYRGGVTTMLVCIASHGATTERPTHVQPLMIIMRMQVSEPAGAAAGRQAGLCAAGKAAKRGEGLDSAGRSGLFPVTFQSRVGHSHSLGSQPDHLCVDRRSAWLPIR